MRKLFAVAVLLVMGSSTTLMAQQLKKTSASKSEKKMLVTYFSVPERDDVDASTGASRIISDGKLVGTTEYVAKIIADATGADLFQVKTVHTYPGTHKALVDYAKKEADTKTYPKMASKIKTQLVV